MNEKTKCTYKATDYSGFFSIYNNSLCLIDYCLKNNCVPYVDLSGCMYNDPPYDGNLWDVFFEPIEVYPDEEYAIKEEIFFDNRKFKYDIPLYAFRSFPESKSDREKCHRLVRHIKIKKNIVEEAETFFNENFDTNVLGVHIRNSQFNLFEYKKVLNNSSIKSSEVDIDKVGPTFGMYVNEIMKFLEKNPTYKVFLATDSASIYKLLQFKKEIRDKLIKYPITFLEKTTTTDRVKKSEENGIKLGKDILIDVLLLSKCNHFIWSYSNISAAVLIMNPFLTHTNITSYLKR